MTSRQLQQTGGTNAKGGVVSQCKRSYSCSYGHPISDIPSDVEHDSHQCDAQYCPIPCQLCKRLCSSPNHLHALEEGTIHLCGCVIRSVLTTAKRNFFEGNHIPVLSGVALLVCVKSIWLQNLSKKPLEEGMNASSTQRYIFTSLDSGSNTKRARCSIRKVNFASPYLAFRSQ